MPKGIGYNIAGKGRRAMSRKRRRKMGAGGRVKSRVRAGVR